jgi:hypothetical protein
MYLKMYGKSLLAAASTKAGVKHESVGHPDEPLPLPHSLPAGRPAARCAFRSPVRLLSPMHRLSPMTLIASERSDFFESASARSHALIAIKGLSIGCR